MKSIGILIVACVVLSACNSVKKSQKAINTGNYDTSIRIAVNKLSNNKTKKGNQVYIYQLEEAFQKAYDNDMRKIRFLEKENNPEHLKTIYTSYLNLKNRQEQIRPLLPLFLSDQNREANFEFNDFSTQLLSAKDAWSEYAYTKAITALSANQSKQGYRKIYRNLSELNRINPAYEDVAEKLKEARYKGIDFVNVALYNDTEFVIPRRLEQELLNFNTYDINDFWTQYHNDEQAGIDYSYEMILAFKEILISPEQISKKEIIKEKRVRDGWRYRYDANGNILKDSLGKKIKIDIFKNVHATLHEFSQFKAVQLSALVAYKDLRNDKIINSYPISSEFVFEHYYAVYKGDERALDAADIPLIEIGVIPFPTNEQMIYDTGEDLKQRLKNVIKKHAF